MRCGVVRTQRLYLVCVTSHTASYQRTTRYAPAVRAAPQQQKRLVVLQRTLRKGTKMDEKRNITGDQITVKAAADGHIPLDIDYESLEKSMERSKDKYLRYKQDFFNSCADDSDFLTKCKRWQRAAHDYLRWAGTLFNVCKDDLDKRQAAREIMDKITKDSSIRHRNLCKHTEYVSSKDPEKIDKMDKAEFESAAFLRNAALTQDRFNELFEKGENYNGSELQAEAED